MPESFDRAQWIEVLALYERAAELPDSERSAFLHASRYSSQIVKEVLRLLSDVTSEPSELQKRSEAPEPIEAGTVLGKFNITGGLGRGGMGQVYSAIDTVLQRRVAIKFLSDEIRDSLHVVVREARTASALNHVNIVTIYEVLQADSKIAIVMELVEGQGGRELCKNPVTLQTLVQIGTQLSQALLVAHAAGVVHRDIKPENLMLRSDGCVKILDFGLAHSVHTVKDASASPTPALHGGGTWRYMSPEQAKSEPVDSATDIFSLGILLYELATGRHPFASDSALETLRRIVASTPETPSSLNPSIPGSFDHLLLALLAKDPRARPSASSIATMLAAALKASNHRRKNVWRARLGQVLVAACITALVTFLWMRWRHAARANPESTINFQLAQNAHLAPFSSLDRSDAQPSFSPDGAKIAYSSTGLTSSSRPAIYVKPVPSGTPTRLTSDTAEETNPVWSPNGTQIAFFRYANGAHDPSVVLVPAKGGPERTIARVKDRRISRSTLAWLPNSNGLIVADDNLEDEHKNLSLFQLSLDGEKKLVTRPPPLQSDFEPTFSPDGRWMAFLRGSYADYSNIWVEPAQGGNARPITSGANVISSLAWAPDSHNLIFSINSGGLWRIGLNGGSPLSFLNTEGETEGLTVSHRNDRLAYVRNYESLNIWRVPIPGTSHSTPVKLLSSARDDFEPTFSPDGSRLAFSSNRSGTYQIWISGSDGSSPRQITFFEDSLVGSPTWSPDGTKVAYDARVNGNADIYVTDVRSGIRKRITDAASAEVVPSWSSDGAWIYFCSNRSGLRNIWKVPVLGGTPQQVTLNGGFECRQTPDSKFLYYTKDTTISGIWRMPATGGSEEFIPELRNVYRFRYWALTGSGIYFVTAEPQPLLHRYRFDTRQVTSLVSLSRPPGDSFRGLAIGPDEKSILYCQYDLALRQIMLVGNLSLRQ